MRNLAEDGADGRSGDPEAPDGAAQASPWEWVAGVVSLCLVLGAIGVLGYEALSTRGTPPEISLEVDTVVPASGGFLVTLLVTNSGEVTAADLLIEGELRSGAESLEKAEVTIRYVPSESSRRAGMFFSHDPRQYTLYLRPKGYEAP